MQRIISLGNFHPRILEVEADATSTVCRATDIVKQNRHKAVCGIAPVTSGGICESTSIGITNGWKG